MQFVRTGFSLLRNASSWVSPTMIGRVLPPSASTSTQSALCQNARSFSCFSAVAVKPLTDSFLLGGTRSIVRNHFPRPQETKRIRRHGWKKRLSTEAGRKIIMRRILKGKYILSH